MSAKTETPATMFFLICASLAAMLFTAFIAVKLWTWFAVPFGAPLIGVAHMFGLRLLLTLFAGRLRTHDDGKDWDRLCAWVLFCFMAWGLGALCAAVMT